MKPKKYPQFAEEEIVDVACPEYGEEIVTPPPTLPPTKAEEKDNKPDDNELVYSFIVKQLDEFVKLQVMTSTLEGKRYLVIPKKYFDTKPEEIVMLDDCVLVPFSLIE